MGVAAGVLEGDKLIDCLHAGVVSVLFCLASLHAGAPVLALGDGLVDLPRMALFPDLSLPVFLLTPRRSKLSVMRRGAG